MKNPTLLQSKKIVKKSFTFITIISMMIFLNQKKLFAQAGPNGSNLFDSDFFTPNKGQVRDENNQLFNAIKFATHFNGTNVFFESDRIQFVFKKVKSKLINNPVDSSVVNVIDSLSKIELIFSNSNPNVQINGIDTLGFLININNGNNGIPIEKIKSFEKVI